MRTITVSSKNQITIPVAILREVGINPGDRMAAAVIDGDIVLVKEPENWVQYFQGSMAGAYGGTKESVDRMILRERQSWYEPMSEHISETDPREWCKRFEDLYANGRQRAGSRRHPHGLPAPRGHLPGPGVAHTRHGSRRGRRPCRGPRPNAGQAHVQPLGAPYPRGRRGA